MREIPIASAEADDNGSYLSRGSVKQHYTYTENGSVTAHRSTNGAWYVNVKRSKEYQKEYVDTSHVYELTRMYRTSKHNPDFSRTMAFVRALSETDPRPFYLVIYRWSKEGQGPKDFVHPRHGNAQNPNTGAYFKKDPKFIADVDELLQAGLSTERVYCKMTKKNPSSLSETITNPKLIDNRKCAGKKEANQLKKSSCDHSEAEALIASLQSLQLVNSVTFNKEQYISVNYLPSMLNDLNRFCVLGNSILRVDTTFELVDGLWLTDTTYTNTALIDAKGKHPEFPGPSFWHFKKTRESYRRFAGELVIAQPSLQGLQRIGHDLDQALAKGMTDIFKDAKQLYCTQHMQERDAAQLHSMGCNHSNKQSILADIYGSQNDIVYQDGLADSDDDGDFLAKLESLKSVWEEKVPGFHAWFTKNRSSYFTENLVMSARAELGIEGRFYTNGLELKHKLQKKALKESEVPKEVHPVTEELQNWSQEFLVEELRALRGLGKYRFAPGFDHFQIDPVRWNRWSNDRQVQHAQAFRHFVPKSYDQYKKPSAAGYKAPPQAKKRRVRLPEPELFQERTPVEQSKAVSPLVLSKTSNSSNWQVS